ncbi:unnamed protein product [Owenia fusiformis]|uniref:Uncharacterized protein n=1 Tax=Owenia fusiformis TaxID=6347 RepID=A0A8J1XUG2_OWEFU|nr:unnamed protein product [Owenia fusiformis]
MPLLKKREDKKQKEADKYVCTLDDETAKRAKEELGEDPKNRMSQVETLRKWIEEQKHLNCRTDTTHLLLYLRCCKFSQLMARKKIENYMKVMTETPEWFKDLNPSDPRILAVLDSTFVFPLPGYDDLGRKVVFFRTGKFFEISAKFNKHDVFRACIMLIAFVNRDEQTQVNGVVYLTDNSGMEMKHINYFGVENYLKALKIWQNSFPGRYKEFHYYNPGVAFSAFMQMAKSVMPDKVKKRLFIHGSNMEDVYKVIPMKMLPDDYLPDEYDGPSPGTVKQIIEKLKKDVNQADFKKEIMDDTSGKYFYDKSAKSEEVPQASFRKLNID